MIAIWGLLLFVGLVYGGSGLVAGFGRPRPRHAFSPGDCRSVREFDNGLDAVRAAYQAGVTRTPGMKLIQSSPMELYVDSRPTARILAGSFGMLLLVSFSETAAGCQVVTEMAPKFAWAVGNEDASFREVERSLRMRAKQAGRLEEKLRT